MSQRKFFDKWKGFRYFVLFSGLHWTRCRSKCFIFFLFFLFFTLRKLKNFFECMCVCLYVYTRIHIYIWLGEVLENWSIRCFNFKTSGQGYSDTLFNGISKALDALNTKYLLVKSHLEIYLNYCMRFEGKFLVVFVANAVICYFTLPFLNEWWSNRLSCPIYFFWGRIRSTEVYMIEYWLQEEDQVLISTT